MGTDDVLVTWVHFTNVADGPNPGPRLGAAARLYQLLRRKGSDFGVTTRELVGGVGEAEPVRPFAFRLTELQSLVKDEGRFGLFRANSEVDHDMVKVLVDLLAQFWEFRLCEGCLTFMEPAGDVLVCPGCGQVSAKPVQ